MEIPKPNERTNETQQIQKTDSDTERHPYLFVTCKIMDDGRSPVEEIMTIILLYAVHQHDMVYYYNFPQHFENGEM